MQSIHYHQTISFIHSHAESFFVNDLLIHCKLVFRIGRSIWLDQYIFQSAAASCRDRPKQLFNSPAAKDYLLLAPPHNIPRSE